jgi:hypothetical protein
MTSIPYAKLAEILRDSLGQIHLHKTGADSAGGFMAGELQTVRQITNQISHLLPAAERQDFLDLVFKGQP